MSNTSKLGASLVVLVALLAIAPAPAAQAANTKPYVYPPQAHPYGLTYSQWEVRFLQWEVAVPVPQSPWADGSGAHCAVGQSGPVWYLLTGPGGTIARTCTVPAGKALLISPYFAGCTTAQGDGTTFKALRACAKALTDTMTKAEVTVDGAQVANVATRYRFETPLFTLKYPAANVLSWGSGSMKVPGPGTTRMVGDSLIVVLAPLAPGAHTVHLYSTCPNLYWTGDVTYHLTVRG